MSRSRFVCRPRWEGDMDQPLPASLLRVTGPRSGAPVSDRLTAARSSYTGSFDGHHSDGLDIQSRLQARAPFRGGAHKRPSLAGLSFPGLNGRQDGLE